MKKIIYLLPLFLLLGCGKTIEYKGMCSFEGCKPSTLTAIRALLAEEHCHDIDKAEYNFISKKKNITKEEWIITGCNRTFKYLVRYEKEEGKRLYTGVSKIK